MSAQPTKSKAKPAPPQADAQPRGMIDVEKIYTLSAFKKTIGAGDWALREMRRNGLKVIKVGNLRFVVGSDFATFLTAAGERGDV